MLRSHVERVLMQEWHRHDLAPDVDGDYEFRAGTAQGWVRIHPVLGTSPPMVSIFAHAAVGLKSSARLLRELNELNCASRWCKVYLRHDEVIVARDLDLSATDDPSIRWALETVSAVAKDIGTMLATVYGGSTPFPAEPETAETEGP